MNAQSPFTGTWEHQDGNEVFIVELYLNDDNGIRGHYSKVQRTNNFEVLVYESNFDVGHGLTYGPVINSGPATGNSFTATIYDVTNPNDGDNLGWLIGTLRMEIISSNPTQANWNVKVINDLRVSTDDRVFSFPTDLILTKVE
jgi:hypothetical protein